MAISLVALAITCASPSHQAARDHDPGSDRAPILVVAPHPDDEVLIAAGVMADAVRRGERVQVVVVTNGDFTCARDGYVRERESVEALQRIGIPERDVHFLGYPDGHLEDLGPSSLPPVPRRDELGRCVTANETYARSGAHHLDEHRWRTGRPGAYTDAEIVGDLLAVLERVQPRDIYVTHGIDGHPDHVATYAFLRRAISRLGPRDPMTVHRAVVHSGPCWPDGSGRNEPCPRALPAVDSPMPALPEPLTAYVPTERVLLPSSFDASAKLRTIATYRSQTGLDAAHDWLAAFARLDEAFYPERLARDAQSGEWLRFEPAQPTADAQTRARRRACSGWIATAAAVSSIPLTMRPDERTSRYELDLDDSRSFALDRIGAAERTVLWHRRRPSGFDGSGPVRVEFDMRPDDGGVAEIAILLGGVLLGFAIDPNPVGDTSAPSTTPQTSDSLACAPF